MNHLNLAALREGQQAMVTSIQQSGPMARRLRDMGLTKGTPVRCLHLSPFGDPVAYLVRGAVIALRREDSRQVLVTLS